MRRDSATIVVLTGQFSEGLLAQAGRSLNVSVARVPDHGDGSPEDGSPAARPAFQVSTTALRSAAGRSSGYVLLPADPLADVAHAWQAMWQAGAAPDAAAAFEQRAAEALAAWRARQFELPDYYLVVTDPAAVGPGPGDSGRSQGPDQPGWYLGPLQAARPRRVALAITGGADRATKAAPVLDALRSLEHGPWWPPLDELIDAVRHFYAGAILPA